MLGYQSLAFHDALYVRRALGLRPAPEFDAWLARQGMTDESGGLRDVAVEASPLRELAAGVPR